MKTVVSDRKPSKVQENIFSILNLLEEHRQHILIDFKHLQNNYQRQGIKRIKAQRDKDDRNKLTYPHLKTIATEPKEYVEIHKFTVNRNSATINLLISHPVKLTSKNNQEESLPQVAGILLQNLRKYNNYTIVSDGQFNVKQLKIKINSKKTFKLLKEKQIITQANQTPSSYSHEQEYELNFANLSLRLPPENLDNLDVIYQKILSCKILNSLISSIIKQESENYSPLQLQELKKHYLSKNIYLNFPTTNQYNDRKKACQKGILQSKVSQKIDLGNTQILNSQKLYSANKFLQRFYVAYDQENQLISESLNCQLILEDCLQWQRKKLSHRLQITPVDELMSRIYDDFLGIEKNGTVKEILNSIEADELKEILNAKEKDQIVDREDFIELLIITKNTLDKNIEKLFHQYISPLVFYIGVTDSIPEQLKGCFFTCEQIQYLFPELKIAKKEQAGRFFLTENTIISIYPQTVYYSSKSSQAKKSSQDSCKKVS